jgi:hypothetical protein
VFLFNIFFLKIVLNKKHKISQILLILFFNNNLSFFKNKLTNIEKNNIFLNRYKSYPVLHLIHNKIDFMFNEKNYNTVSFKQSYKIHSYINQSHIYKILGFNEQSNINFKLILNILLNNLKQQNNYLNALVMFLVYRNSISSKKIIITQIIKNNKIEKLNNNFIHINYSKLNDILEFKNNNIYLKISSKLNNVIINSDFKFNLINVFKISFSASSIVKYLSDSSINKSVILFLRKNKIFNKSRYSRNRQTYRTGAY